MARTCVAALVLLVALTCAQTRVTRAAASAGAQTWLLVSDVHLDPFDRRTHPSLFGSDTNVALFRSAMAEMRRRVPDPAVVLIPGDFLAHDFARRAARNGVGAQAAAVSTMAAIANAFDRAYPRARFAIALGNNDAPCGDYHSALQSAYARSVARIWAPLVNRAGSAADFESSFAANGSYVAALPLRDLRLVVLDDVPYASPYLGDCGADGRRDPVRQDDWLARTLDATPPQMRNVVMMHVPPGYDPLATEETRGFFPWPFLTPAANAAVSGALSDPNRRVSFAIAGHAHRFDFRLAGDVPIVVFGSLSPVYHNNPAFYALDVAADGTLLDVRAFAFDEWTQSWQPARSFDAKWQVTSLDAPALAGLHQRLERDRALRRAWDASSSGWPSNWSIAWSTWGERWRIPWCAQVHLDGRFAACAGLSARAFVFRLGLVALAACAGLLLVGLAYLIARSSATSSR